MGLGPHRFFCKAIWKLDTIPNIWVFTWQMGHEILLTKVKIAFIRHGFGQECPRCGVEKETLIHALKYCPTSRAILSIGGLDNSIISKEYHCCIDWLEDMMKVLDKRAIADLMTTLWNSWNNRNNFILRGKEEEAQVVWDRARTLSQDLCICNLLNDLLLLANPAVKRWEKPPRGHVKINFYASVRNNRVGYEVIVRDEYDFVMGGGRGFKDETMLVEKAESYAFDECIKISCKLYIKTYVIFETNNASLVNKVKHHCMDVTVIGARIKESLKAFENFKVAKGLSRRGRPCASKPLVRNTFQTRIFFIQRRSTNPHSFGLASRWRPKPLKKVLGGKWGTVAIFRLIGKLGDS
ncbi:reverse transcriptase [Gossypium australe]|uniref:Reverse transcriptase n=1 Tax=Gossypium australe TaxID=47621 RepID=A0A5B6WNY4_9ROSI|nr:reverse transcriptase [Gossypium australe]